ncbi:hypothetical protein [Moorella stamsii]|uniref:hypothetical protein n=1 Tax=Neomoorella stamsii TaxID=1266720 RepID=UPI0012EDCDC3|nr:MULTISPECIES: hypothetical protein [Moorella]
MSVLTHKLAARPVINKYFTLFLKRDNLPGVIVYSEPKGVTYVPRAATELLN